MSGWQQDQECPCCRKVAVSPRLLGCLHSVCTPCMNKVENVMGMLEKKKCVQATGSRILRPRALQPLGKFLCPVCNTSHIISRLGVSVIPVSLSHHNPTYSEEGMRCIVHSCMVERFCLSCNKQICKECTENTHGQHHTEDMDKVRSSLDTALRDAAKEIAERMQTIETDIARIRVARESEAHDRRKLRREVVTYYEGYVNNVNKHKANLERKISMQQENTANILIKEEVQLEQYRLDLKSLCAQIQKLLSLKNCTEVVNLMVPVAKKLETIIGEIMTAGEAIINKLQFVPKSLSNGDIPGFLSTFSVCQAKSYAVIDGTIYEKVLCSISLYLVDGNGLKLDVYHEIDIQAVMTLYHKQDKNCQTVNVSVENDDSAGSGGWSLVFNPPFPGIAHLSVTVDGVHIKNSPYVITVKTLSLDDTVKEISKARKSVYLIR